MTTLHDVERVVELARNTWRLRAKLIIEEQKLYEALLASAPKTETFRPAYEAAIKNADKAFRESPLAQTAVRAAAYIEEFARQFQTQTAKAQVDDARGTES